MLDSHSVVWLKHCRLVFSSHVLQRQLFQRLVGEQSSEATHYLATITYKSPVLKKNCPRHVAGSPLINSLRRRQGRLTAPTCKDDGNRPARQNSVGDDPVIKNTQCDYPDSLKTIGEHCDESRMTCDLYLLVAQSGQRRFSANCESSSFTWMRGRVLKYSIHDDFQEIV